MRLVTGCATQPECRLMQVRFLKLLGLVAVTREAGAHRIGLDKARRFSGVRIVACNAFPLSTRMLDFCFLNLLSLIAVAGHTQSFGI